MMGVYLLLDNDDAERWYRSDVYFTLNLYTT